MKTWIPFAVVAFCSILGATGQILFKISSGEINFSRPVTLINPKLIIGVILYTLASAIFIYILKFGNVSILYPIVALSYVWVAIMASLILHEPFPAAKWAGIAMILGGVFLIVK